MSQHTWSNQRGYGFLTFGATCEQAASCDGVSRRAPFPWNRLEPLTDACRARPGPTGTVPGTYLNRQSVDFTQTPAVHQAAYRTCEPCRAATTSRCPRTLPSTTASGMPTRHCGGTAVIHLTSTHRAKE